MCLHVCAGVTACTTGTVCANVLLLLSVHVMSVCEHVYINVYLCVHVCAHAN